MIEPQKRLDTVLTPYFLSFLYTLSPFSPFNSPLSILNFLNCHTFHFYKPPRSANGSMHYYDWHVWKFSLHYRQNDLVVSNVSKVYNDMCDIVVRASSFPQQYPNVLRHAIRLIHYVTFMHNLSTVVYTGRSRYKHMSAVVVFNGRTSFKAHSIFTRPVEMSRSIKILHLFLS